MILADPHWGQVQVYQTPIPLWPAQLQPGWQTHFKTMYKTPTNKNALLWDQTMRARSWESVTVPAGQFKTLRFTNMINFTQCASDCGGGIDLNLRVATKRFQQDRRGCSA